MSFEVNQARGHGDVYNLNKWKWYKFSRTNDIRICQIRILVTDFHTQQQVLSCKRFYYDKQHAIFSKQLTQQLTKFIKFVC
jgi:hypothetical protein